MRQSGMMAAAGLHAIDHHLDRLADDHDNAARLAKGLAGIAGVTVTRQATNMVFIQFETDPTPILAALAAADIVVAGVSGGHCRLVTHLDVSSDDIDRVVEVTASVG